MTQRQKKTELGFNLKDVSGGEKNGRWKTRGNLQKGRESWSEHETKAWKWFTVLLTHGEEKLSECLTLKGHSHSCSHQTEDLAPPLKISTPSPDRWLKRQTRSLGEQLSEVLFLLQHLLLQVSDLKWEMILHWELPVRYPANISPGFSRCTVLNMFKLVRCCFFKINK